MPIPDDPRKVPLGEAVCDQAELICTRSLPDGHCASRPTHHVLWTAEMDNSLTCDAHTREVRERWEFYDIHPIEGACGMPGSRFLIGEGCYLEVLDVDPR